MLSAKTRIPIIAAGLFLAFFGLILWCFPDIFRVDERRPESVSIGDNQVAPPTDRPASPSEQPADAGQANFIFVGDVMLSRHIGELMEKNKNYDFPFIYVKDFLAAGDLVFGNLESVISDQGKSAGHLYSFRADPRAAPALRDAGFTVLSVANNHAFDYGLEAFIDTFKNLKNAGLAYAGGGRDQAEAHQGAFREVNGIKTTVLAYTDLLPKSQAASDQYAGYAYPGAEQLAEDIRTAKAKSDLVIVSFHWGDEYATRHNRRQEEMAKAAIDAGADLIIGHHPHVIQDIGEYKGVTIAYSLGNFIFDQNFSPDTAVGLALEVAIKDRKIAAIEQRLVRFNRYFQPALDGE